MDNVILREKLINKSRVREIFTPFSPVKKSELLSGREAEISSLLACINTPGQHALIYGNRGIGKSSVANIVSELAQETLNYTVYLKKCSSDDTFSSIVSDVLAHNGYDIYCTESVNEHTETSGAKAGLSIFSANISSNKKNQNKVSHEQQFSSPSWVAKVLQDCRLLLIVDEADVIRSNEEKLKLAEFLKHLSDYESKLKVLIVGISETGRDLISNHRSVERCLNEISLQPIGITELRNIIKVGEEKLGLVFVDEVIDDIVDISGGYPHFVHLIALKCAEEVIANQQHNVTTQVLGKALKLAAKYSEGNLKRTYEDTIKKSTDTSKKILLGAALCHPRGFLVSELVEMINEVIDANLSKSAISKCLSRWVKELELDVIIKVERGHYRFSDPRLMSYIKMVNGFTYDKRSVVADILKAEYSKRYVSDNT